MSGTNMTESKVVETSKATIITPEMAAKMIDHCDLNRPLNDRHLKRLVKQIINNKWKYNGDTIKISKNGNVLDGQHRLWAVIEANKSIESIIVYDIDSEAFSTIDTIRRIRTAGDTLYIKGLDKYRAVVGTSLTWLIRYERDVIKDYRLPDNKIENYDIEKAYIEHPGILYAVEKCMKLRYLMTPAIIAFIYYITSGKNELLAERFINTLINPSTVSIYDPFFKLRACFVTRNDLRRNNVFVIALTIKAFNKAYKGESCKFLGYRIQGEHPEPFPVLKI